MMKKCVVLWEAACGGKAITSYEAHHWTIVFELVKVHSRPIHLLLADVSIDAHVPILKKHRSDMQIVFVKTPVQLDEVLARVRQLLGTPPPSIR
jgi:hypothetical protein